MPDEPLVSICIPTYNRAGMIGRAIESALGQTYRNIEVIVVDNASTDKTDEVIAIFSDQRLKYVKNDRNLGLFGNFNRCIELARGEIIHILHSDDHIDPDFTQTCIRFFLNHPNVVLTFTSAKLRSGTNEIDISYSDKDEIFRAPEGFRRVLTERPFIICPSVMMKRSIYEECGNYSLEFPYSSDLNQWLKVTRRHDIGFVRNAWLYYRQGEHSESYRQLFTNVTGYLDTLKIFANLINTLGNDRIYFNEELNISFRRLTLDCLFAGFTRSDIVDGFNPSFFTGIALTVWSMVKPSSFIGWFHQAGMLLIILVSGCVMGIPFLRRIVKRLLLARISFY
jgi:glycosyltransferase involved in cell wall biosynthesis